MNPDFSAPAFAFVAICTLHFLGSAEGGGAGPYHSDYRCQLHYDEACGAEDVVEVRVYLVGRESVNAGQEAPALLAFLDWEGQPARCREGITFELKEGRRKTATGRVHAVAIRERGT